VSNSDNRREHIRWETVAVTALPSGWRNVYRLDDGTLAEHPCPAILVQENRGTHLSWDEPGTEARFTRCNRFEPAEPPYEIRAVFADHDYGHLEPAVRASNYVATAGPGETADEAAAE
jgi:hypothetical protein